MANRLRNSWNWIKEHFDSPDRRIGSYGVILGFIAVVLGIIPLALPGTPAIIWWFILYNFLLLLGLFCFTIYLAVKYALRGKTIESQIDRMDRSKADSIQQISQSKAFLSNQFKNSHDIVHGYRDEMFKQYYHPGVQHRLKAEEHRHFRHLCRHTTFILRRALKEYFLSREIDIGEDISVSVKLIFTSDEVIERFEYLPTWKRQEIKTKERWVVTVYRDPITFETMSGEREVNARAYDIEDNTAFDNIYNHKDQYFRSNDLQGITAPPYKNTNDRWTEQYNATLVVPIRYEGKPHSNHYTCYGFLAVDSLNRNKETLYTDQECLYILGHSADLLATFLLSVALGKYQATESPVHLPTTEP